MSEQDLKEQNDRLQKKLDDFTDLVRRMRGWQRQRDRYRFLATGDQKRMQYLQRRVDEMVEAHEKEIKSKQTKLY